MFHELENVVLKNDMQEYDLKKGDIGTVVHLYDQNKAVEVEFVTAEGKTIAILTLTPNDIRPMQRSEILHVRDVDSFSTI